MTYIDKLISKAKNVNRADREEGALLKNLDDYLDANVPLVDIAYINENKESIKCDYPTNILEGWEANGEEKENKT